MIQSLDDLAENTLRMLGGETIVALDPADLDGSFVSDRIGEDDEEYQDLKEAIRQSGQTSPILVRPHPSVEGRYMIVFGHRRARVAAELGKKVRAIVKQVADVEHVVAQGQENAARADLTFIEKALFGRKLQAAGMSKDVIKIALTVDDSLLSRMLSVAEVVPSDVLNALGASKGIGRDRWEELKKAVLHPAMAKLASEMVNDPEFLASPTHGKFQRLLKSLKTASRKAPKREKAAIQPKPWAAKDGSVSVVACRGSKGFSMEFVDREAGPFGEWISNQLDSLFEAYRKMEREI